MRNQGLPKHMKSVKIKGNGLNETRDAFECMITPGGNSNTSRLITHDGIAVNAC